MAFIVDFFATRVDKSIQLGNEEILRPLSIGTNWQKIRIGIRLALQGLGNINGAGFAIGVCAGNSGWKASSTVEWVGMHFGATLDNTQYVYNIASPPYFTIGTVSLPVVTKISGVTTNRSGGSQTSYMAALPTTAISTLYCDITKGTPYAANPYNPNSIANVQTNVTQSLFIQGMETDGTPNTSGSNGSSTWTHPGPGLMDTLSIAWNRSTPTINIFEVAVARIL